MKSDLPSAALLQNQREMSNAPVLVKVGVVTHGSPSPESQSMTHLRGGPRACGEEQLQRREKQQQEVTMKGRGKSSDLLWCVIVLTQEDDTSKDGNQNNILKDLIRYC